MALEVLYINKIIGSCQFENVSGIKTNKIHI